MVNKQMSLKRLRGEVAREREKIRKLQEREKLEKKLRELRGAGRSDVAGRIKRGFIIITRKAGQAALKQGRLIRERQIQEAKRSKKKRGGLSGRDNIFAPLDF